MSAAVLLCFLSALSHCVANVPTSAAMSGGPISFDDWLLMSVANGSNTNSTIWSDCRSLSVKTEPPPPTLHVPSNIFFETATSAKSTAAKGTEKIATPANSTVANETVETATSANSTAAKGTAENVTLTNSTAAEETVKTATAADLAVAEQDKSTTESRQVQKIEIEMPRLFDMWYKSTDVWMNMKEYLSWNNVNVSFQFSFWQKVDTAQVEIPIAVQPPLSNGEFVPTNETSIFASVGIAFTKARSNFRTMYDMANTPQMAPVEYKETSAKMWNSCLRYCAVIIILSSCSQVSVKDWNFCRKDSQNGVYACPAMNYMTKEISLHQTTSVPNNSRRMVFPVMVGLALYIHYSCALALLIPVFLIEFVGFTAKSWFHKLEEFGAMESVFKECLLCLVDILRAMIPCTVLQLATAGVVTATYAMPIIFEAPPRFILGVGPAPYGVQAFKTPNPLWLVIEANSTLGTWQAVMNKSNKTEEIIFLHFTTTEYLVYITIMKYVLDAAIIGEIFTVDVPSYFTGVIIKLKCAIVFYYISHVVNIGGILQMSWSTLCVNSIMIGMNFSVVGGVNVMLGAILRVLHKAPYVGWMVNFCFKDMTKVFTVTHHGNSIVDLFTMTSTADPLALHDNLTEHVFVCMFVVFMVCICCQLLWTKHSEDITLVKDSIISVVTQSHASTLIVVSLVWTLIGVYMLCARPYAFFTTPLSLTTTNLYTDWPFVVVLILCVDVAINLLWLLVFIVSTVYAHKCEMKKIEFATVAFLHSHEQSDRKVKNDHIMILQHTCVLFPTLQASVRNSLCASNLQIIGRVCDVKTSIIVEDLMSSVSLTHHLRSACFINNGVHHIFLGNMARAIMAHSENEVRIEDIRQKKRTEKAQDRARARLADIHAAATLKPNVATASPVGVVKPVPPVPVVNVNITTNSNWKVITWLKNMATTKQAPVAAFSPPVPAVTPPVPAVTPPVTAIQPTARTGSIGRSGPQHQRGSSSEKSMRFRFNVETKWNRDEETFEQWLLRTAVRYPMTPEFEAMRDNTEAKRIRKRNEKTCGCNPFVFYGAAFFYSLLVIFQLWTFTSGAHLIPGIS